MLTNSTDSELIHKICNVVYRMLTLALGRKNYLFCGNDASAYRAAIVYSLIATCKSAEVDPRIWMEDVLSKIPYYERDEKNMEELLPRNWAKSNQTCSE